MSQRQLWERRLLRVIAYTPIASLVIFAPMAIIWSSGSDFVIGLGLVFEIAGALAIVGRAIAEEVGFWLVREEADARTLPVFYVGAILLPVGFLLQFVAVVFM